MTQSQVHSTKIPCHVTSSVTNVSTWSIMNVSYRSCSRRVTWKLPEKPTTLEVPSFSWVFWQSIPSIVFSWVRDFFSQFEIINSPSYKIFLPTFLRLNVQVYSCQFDWFFFQPRSSGQLGVANLIYPSFLFSKCCKQSHFFFAVVDDWFSPSFSILKN